METRLLTTVFPQPIHRDFEHGYLLSSVQTSHSLAEELGNNLVFFFSISNISKFFKCVWNKHLIVPVFKE